MNKKTGKLYGDLMDYIYKHIPSDGDGRLECEGKLHLLIKSLKTSTVEEQKEKDAEIAEGRIHKYNRFRDTLLFIYKHNNTCKTIAKAIREQ